MDKDTQRFHIAAVSTNQHALDFEGNKRNIFESIEACKKMGVTYRAGAELEVCGYSCEDHFKEIDTVNHCWEVVAELLESDLTVGIQVEMNMPVLHRSVMYNCKVLCLNKKIIAIRPKIEMADENVYKESRYFQAYEPAKDYELEDFELPNMIAQITGQRYVPLGLAIYYAHELTFGLEICQELWLLNDNPGKIAFMNNADVVINCNGSCFTTDKLEHRVEMVRNETSKMGGAYVYVNLIGCDGQRVYFDGGNIIAQNGEILGLGPYHTQDNYEILDCVINIQKIRLERHTFTSGQRQVHNNTKRLPIINIDFEFCTDKNWYSKKIEPKYDIGVKQQMEVVASYLWDYLRKSNQKGFFLPLSGGSDSACIALCVYYLCEKIFKALEQNNEHVLKILRKIVRVKDYNPKSAKEICGKIFYTSYLASPYSGDTTTNRAKELGEHIGCTHFNMKMHNVLDEMVELIKENLNFTPRFKSQGGYWQEDIALQNIQARCRMVYSYLMADILSNGPDSGPDDGSQLILATGNLDEILMGYMTKYDCSSGDIGPIETLNKKEVFGIIRYMYEQKGWSVLNEILTAAPTAELQPVTNDGKIQTDEEDMGLTYHELAYFALFRCERCSGPFSMFDALMEVFPELDLDQLQWKVERFFNRYTRNRHKIPVGTPSIHLRNYSSDGKIRDVRPFFYTSLKWQYDKIEEKKQKVQLKQIKNKQE